MWNISIHSATTATTVRIKEVKCIKTYPQGGSPACSPLVLLQKAAELVPELLQSLGSGKAQSHSILILQRHIQLFGHDLKSTWYIFVMFFHPISKLVFNTAQRHKLTLLNCEL